MSLLRAQPIEAIHIIGRRSAADAKFTDHELAELGTLRGARPVVVDHEGLGGDSAVVKTLQSFAGDDRDTPVTINFHFNLTPTAFAGGDGLRTVQFRAANGDVTELPAQLAVTCIGYEARSCNTAVPVKGIFSNDSGKVNEGLYVVGWAKRGPSGTIPTNRAEAQQVAQKIAQEVADSTRSGTAALRRLLEERRIAWVDHAAWRRIDAAELARAADQRCRTKFNTVAEMLDAAQVGQTMDCSSGKK